MQNKLQKKIQSNQIGIQKWNFWFAQMNRISDSCSYLGNGCIDNLTSSPKWQLKKKTRSALKSNDLPKSMPE